MKARIFFLSLIVLTSALGLIEESYTLLSDMESTKATFGASSCFYNCTDNFTIRSTFAMEPAALLYLSKSNTEAGFVLNNISEYDSIDYTITIYSSNTFGLQKNAILGTINNSSHLSIIQKEGLTLGTCSDDICEYYQNISKLELKANLLKPGSDKVTIIDSISL